jgi:UDP-glucuronate 4-epimerase
MKRIFISGIAGFIGFHLAQALHKRGDIVVGCDNFNPYYDPLLKRDRARELHKKEITVFESDVVDQPFIACKLAEHKITHFVHLAAQAGVRYSAKHPESYIHSNLHGFVHTMEALRSFPSIKLIYASSSSVYGLNEKTPFAESDPTEHPTSLYGATKKANELIAHAYHYQYGIPCTGLRFFTVYGPWGRPDMAYFSFTKSILEGKPITLFGKDNLKRDFTYIDDIINGTLAAIDLSPAYEIFNLGNNRPESVLNLVNALEQLLGKKAIVEFHPMPKGEVPITFADISKSEHMLGFHPITSLQTGLKQFVDWYRAYYPHGPHQVPRIPS